jgi:ADP-ribose pyrophosphatase YjhB (NUDIX family)
MPVPEFVAALREKVGHDALWLTTADAIIIEHGRVLLLSHAGLDEWMYPGGHVDPGEHPAAAAEREALEETGLTVAAENLVAVTVSPMLTYANGDKAQHLEMAFACRIVSGEAHVADSESADVRWFPLGGLPELRDRYRAVIRHAADGTQGLLRLAG